MEEGEALSRKQLAQEQTIKKLRAAAKEAKAQVRAASSHRWPVPHWLLLPASSCSAMGVHVRRRPVVPAAQAAARPRSSTRTHVPAGPPLASPPLPCPPQIADLTAALDGEKAKAASAVSERAATAGELYGIREQHAAELAAERQHYERQLEEARAAAAAVDARAAEAAKAGAVRRLKDAEARAEALEGTLAELRGELERQVRGAAH